MRRPLLRIPPIAIALVFLASVPPRARANCNVIPGSTSQFRGALGAADRPYAMPGDFVGLTIRPEVCDADSRRLADHDGDGEVDAADHLVTILFEPPQGGPRNAVVVAASCAAVTPKLAACNAQLGGGSASCVEAPASDLVVTPGSNEDRLRFRFPDTDALVQTPSDDRTLAGPATIAVTPANLPLPCSLATTRCADTGGLVACIDELYAIDGTCKTAAAGVDPTFGSFTALPPPNDYEAVCDTPDTPCDGAAPEVRFTTDVTGNALVPWDWGGVLVRLDDVPVPRLVRGSTSIEAFAGGPADPIELPGDSFLSSFSPQGHRLPPIFTPLADPTTPGEATLFGSVDARLGVMRVARRSATFQECAGGANAGLACNEAAECPGGSCGAATCRGGSNPGAVCTSDATCTGGGECGAALFEFRDRYASGVGPIVVSDTSYDADAESPVPLNGLSQTSDLFAFVRSEALENQDLNGDGDQTDPVLTLRDKHTGVSLSIGELGSPGRAATRIRDLPFTYPAVETEGDVVAYLEPEPLQGNCVPATACDRNDNGSLLDTNLRVFRVSGGTAVELSVGGELSIDAAPVLNERSLVLSGGRLFFRVREGSLAPRIFEQVDVGPGGVNADSASYEISMSPNGRFLTFNSYATNLVSADANSEFDVFLRDRRLQHTERISEGLDGSDANGPSQTSGVSSDGRIVTFTSYASNLGPEDGNGQNDVFVKDRVLSATERISPDTDGYSAAPSMSDDGRFVTFFTYVAPWVDPEFGLVFDFDWYLHDRALDTTRRVSSFFDYLPPPPFGVSIGAARISALGNSLLVHSASQYGQPSFGVAVIDLGNEEVRSLPEGAPLMTMSEDGRLVAYESSDPVTPGDTNGVSDLFVRETFEERWDRVTVSSSGEPANDYSSTAALSGDGRYVVFGSAATNLAADSPVPGVDLYVYVRDRLTGLTEIVPQGVRDNTPNPVISRDGSVVAFETNVPSIVPGDQNTFSNLFVWAPDPSAASADLNSDGDLEDTVLAYAVLGEAPVSPVYVSPAERVVVEGGRALFLQSEGASGSDLNSDGDQGDLVVHLLADGASPPAENLGLAANGLAMSNTHLAALVGEAAQAGASRNGDADLDDTVVAVREVSGGGWVNVGQAADAVAVDGARVVFATPEAGQNGMDLNGDGDAIDRVLQVYDASVGTLTNTGRAVEEFVVAGDIVAFRSSEAAQGDTDANGDGDALDAVLLAYDLATGQLRSSGQSAVPCDLEVCDPRVPYRVKGSSVTFLTLEAKQGAQDLNGDGDATDLVVQVFHATQPSVEAPVVLASANAGLCTDSGLPCADDSECASDSCFVPPGDCVRNLGTVCNPDQLVDACPSGQFCRPSGTSSGFCHQVESNDCKSTLECASGAICDASEQETQRLAAPLARAAAVERGEVLPSTGTCRETLPIACASDAQCQPGEFCMAGTCQREHGPCVTTADCPAGTCTTDKLVTASADDRDGDGLADPIDNCPDVANAEQADADGDDIGDSCDLWICGNGVREGTPGDAGIEECDDGDQDPGDGCGASCQLEAPDCSDGFDNDGDGKTDFGTNPSNDPGCQQATGIRENAQCDDGVDNDFDGQVDHPADTKCRSRADNDERSNPPCGLGAEIVVLLVGVVVLRRQRGARAL